MSKRKLPADWFKDSSLETWFPLTAEEIKRDKHRILVLQRALLLQARRQHLPIDVITPERRVQRWIEDAEESLKPVEYDPQSIGSYRDVFDADGEQ